MGTIFISYARRDKEAASEIAQMLKFRGAGVWWDRDLLSGEHYIETILRQIHQADHVLVLLSQHSVKSKWVSFEIGASCLREVMMDRKLLKIIQLEQCDTPGFIAARQVIPWSSDRDEDLLRALGLPEDVNYKDPRIVNDKSLLVFKAGGQWMELIASERGIDLVLVDSGEQRARIVWNIERNQKSATDDIRVQSPREVAEQQGSQTDNLGWGLFTLDNGWHNWRWTPALYAEAEGDPPEVNFVNSLKEFLNAAMSF